VTNATKIQLLEAYMEKRPVIRRFLVARFRDENIADDILQELYLKIQSATLVTPVGNSGAFLYKTANNLALDFRRQANRRTERDHAWTQATSSFLGGEAVHDAADSDAAIDANSKFKRILYLIKKLPPQCGKVFVLHKLDGFSHAEVAEKLQISKSTVEKHMSKALKYLVLHMGEKE